MHSASGGTTKNTWRAVTRNHAGSKSYRELHTSPKWALSTLLSNWRPAHVSSTFWHLTGHYPYVIPDFKGLKGYLPQLHPLPGERNGQALALGRAGCLNELGEWIRKGTAAS